MLGSIHSSDRCRALERERMYIATCDGGATIASVGTKSGDIPELPKQVLERKSRWNGSLIDWFPRVCIDCVYGALRTLPGTLYADAFVCNTGRFSRTDVMLADSQL